MFQTHNSLRQVFQFAGVARLRVVNQGTQTDGDSAFFQYVDSKLAVVHLFQLEREKSIGKYKGEFLTDQAHITFTYVHS